MDVLPRGSQQCHSDRLHPRFPPGRQQFHDLPGDCCPPCRTPVEVPFLSRAPIGVLFLALSRGRALAERKRLFSRRGACTNISTRLGTAAFWGGLAACARVAVPFTRWLRKASTSLAEGRTQHRWMDVPGKFSATAKARTHKPFLYSLESSNSKCVADAKDSFRELPAS